MCFIGMGETRAFHTRVECSNIYKNTQQKGNMHDLSTSNEDKALSDTCH